MKLYFVIKADLSQIGRPFLWKKVDALIYLFNFRISNSSPNSKREIKKKFHRGKIIARTSLLRDLFEYLYVCVCVCEKGGKGAGRSLEVLFSVIPGILIKYSGSGSEFRDCRIPCFTMYPSEYHEPFIDNNVVIKWIDKCLDLFFHMKSYRRDLTM